MSKRTGRKKRRQRMRALALGGLVAVLGLAAVMAVVFAAGGGGDGGSTSGPAASKSGPDEAGPFRGGPRLYASNDSVDLGHVPFNKVVSYAFDVSNVGDAALNIEDIHVATLEGC